MYDVASVIATHLNASQLGLQGRHVGYQKYQQEAHTALCGHTYVTLLCQMVTSIEPHGETWSTEQEATQH